MDLLGDWRRTKYSTEITSADDGAELIVAGWVHDIRNLGSIAFILVRDREGILQVTALKKKLGVEFFKSLTKLSRESVIAVKGKVKANAQVMNGYEILPEELKVLSVAKTPLPLGVADKVGADLDTRLDNRFIDLRKRDVQAIFNIRATLLKAVRKQLESEVFIEVHTPKIVATATEGGTSLFPVRYFEKEVYLNQSPQLYKQLMMATGLDRVYEIGPAFRAETHDTVRHLNEFTSIDIEMAFADEEDAMGVLERLMHRSIDLVMQDNAKDLELLNVELQLPNIPFPRFEYSEMVDLVQSKGIDLSWGEDFAAEAINAIGREYCGFYFITKWPTEIKPFYVQPFEDNPTISRGFDLMFGSKEITSGAQRVHNVELLKERLIQQKLDPENFTFYLNAFEYGMPPHAGWGLGVERTIMILTNAKNIRECVLFPRDRKRLIP